MTIAELMDGRKPNAAFKGLVQTDDFVLAVNFAEGNDQSNYDEYVVAQEGITEHSGTLNPESSDSRYIRKGTSSMKTGNQRQFSVSGSIYVGDDFQDALLAHQIKYGSGQQVIKDYVYFNLLTGEGEEGEINIMVEDDPSGAAGENAGFKATLYTRGNPKAYTYEVKEPSGEDGGDDEEPENTENEGNEETPIP